MLTLNHIVNPLLNWYDGHARVLPWREDPTPYRVWISEIMLQQTRVEAVKPYFERFMREFPTVKLLAEADEDKLLKLWEGLGYYNRARNLQKAAIEIMELYQGILPQEMNELLKLPGIGSYTAGAISSIAYQKPNPAVDGNVLRVIARVMEDTKDVLDQKVKKQYEEAVSYVIPKDRPGAFNQALMELGATVCVPNGMPKCQECPWEEFCKARISGTIELLPHKAKKKPRVIEYKTILLIQDETKVAIRKRPKSGLLAGLYEFPMMEGIRTRDEVLKYVEELGIQAIRITDLEKSKHIFTHKEWHMTGFAIRVDELKKPFHKGKMNGFTFVETSLTEKNYPIPSAFMAYSKHLNIKLGNHKFIKE